MLLFGDSRRSNAKIRKMNNKLELKVMRLSDQVENFKKIAIDYQKEYNQLAKAVEKLSYIILNDEYVKSKLDGDESIHNMNPYQLIKYMEQQYRKKHSEERSLLAELVEKLNQKEQEIESLKVQLSRLMTKEQHFKEYAAEDKASEIVDYSDEKAAELIVEKDTATAARPSHPLEKLGGDLAKVEVIENKNIKPAEGAEQKDKAQGKEEDIKHNKSPIKKHKNMPQFLREKLVGSKSQPAVPLKDNNIEEKSTTEVIVNNSKNEQKLAETVLDIKKQVEKPSSNSVMAHVVDLNDYMSEMTDIMWNIMIAIGKEGLSEAKDIKKLIISGGISDSAFNNALSQLRKMNIVDQERINTGWRWFHSYELSELGKRIYLEKYKNNPVECEKQKLKKEHTTALHGYCIKDASTILKAIFGYDETSTDRRKNSIKLYTGETYIPDIIAKKKEGALVDYFEVELGHHTQTDFNKKCDKMLMVTKNLYFIVPDADTMNRVLARQIGQWVLEKGGKEKLKGTTIYLTTLKKLNDGKWDNIYPF